MSLWTHATGVIRVDGLPFSPFEQYTVEKLAEFIGESFPFKKIHKIATDAYNNDEPYINPLDNCTLPYGSEGSVDYVIHEYNTGMPWAVVTFWGDLRDYDSPEEVIDWAKNLLDKLESSDYYVRQFCFTVSNEQKTLELNNSCYEINTGTSDM
jgi:hypothetical protein